MNHLSFCLGGQVFLYKGRVEEVIPVEDMSHVISDYAKSLLHFILDINM